MNDYIRQHRKKLAQSLAPFVGSETGLLHLYSYCGLNEKSEAIPMALNLTYCLFLLRMKERSCMEKALDELRHLLFFQSSFSVYSGNFPTYLHQYPICERQFEVLDCLYPIYWILKEFQFIMDAGLSEQIRKVVYLALNSLIKKFKELKYSFRLTLQLAVLFRVFGEQYDHNEWLNLSDKFLTELCEFPGEDHWASPRELSRLLLACSLMNEKLMDQFDILIGHFESSWHKKFSTYKGPAYNEFFLREQPEETLYHLFMRYKTTGIFDSNISLLNALNAELFLESSLMKATSTIETLKSKPIIGNIIEHENYSVSWLNWTKENWVKTGGVYPLKILFQDRDGFVHNFVMQMGTFAHIKSLSLREFILEFDPINEEDLEIEFFWDLASNAAIEIESQPATMFEAKYLCYLRFDSLSITLQVVEGFENLWGQVLHKNRRSQLINHVHHSFDKHLYYRSASDIKKKIKLKVCIEFD